ncbi:mannose-1-phosphate guanylyltransferase [Fictibacillus macauensis ZFHKF-1]|uniref:Mannose-1-phosphate guanylyltransferase n=1 Tax=Fictibacillus macauensis ZFHKF-1 TaxID=1196324 RepID=I8IYS8_9BACL|nr:sugar phosphate nucleotidyltransferase [Fictibacillus macauensis]EIT84631.1 mannose-1-phosphate guanylyltransferase [Fictibacillus macauensis ZFHKF-1]
MKAVIMAGGQGTRFWPWSTAQRPKQFLSLRSKDSLLQETYARFLLKLAHEDIYVVTTAEYAPLVLEQLPQLTDERIIIEPCRRDTGPCVALAALSFLRNNDDEVIVTAPSDQYIPDGVAFLEALEVAEEAAKNDAYIVTLGIQPTRPETGYGYIETFPSLVKKQAIVPVKQFVEKPSLSVAQELLKKETIFWNSGIFIWKPSTIAYYMEKHQKELWEKLQNEQLPLQQTYEALPKLSIDYAILEKAAHIYTVPVTFEWDDVGTWGSLERFHDQAEEDNITHGERIVTNGANCTIISQYKTLVLGLSDIIVVCTDEGLLVCHKSEEQHIKERLRQLEDLEKGNEEE